MARARVCAGRGRAGAPDTGDPVQRRSPAAGRPRHLDHLQRRRRRRCTGCLQRRHAGLLRRGRADDRFVADVRLVPGRRRARAVANPVDCARVRRRQGLGRSGRARSGSDRGVAPALERAPLRPAPGAQPAGVAGASADAVGDEGGGAASLRRHHHLRRTAAPGDRADHGRAADRLRAGQLQRPRPGRRAAHPAAGPRARHRRHRQPAVSPGRPDPPAAAAPVAGVGGERSTATAGLSWRSSSSSPIRR